MGEKEYAWTFKTDSLDYEVENSIEECLKQAKLENNGAYEKVYIGIVEDYEASIDTRSLINDISEDVYDKSDVEDYLEDIPEEQFKELDEKLNMVFNEWKTKYGYGPPFFNVKDKVAYDLYPKESEKDGKYKR